MTKLDINTNSSALLVMDIQVFALSMLPASEREKVLNNLEKAIAGARRAGIPVIYVVVQFRDGHPEISPKNKLFSPVKDAKLLFEQDADSRVCDEVSPQPGEIIVTKKRISAFTGSDLEVILRSKGIDTLVLTGVSSLGVVESTARFAVDMDYRLFVLADCCADRDPEINDIALTRVLPVISTVCSTDDFITAI